jgi:hypothetical protein
VGEILTGKFVAIDDQARVLGAAWIMVGMSVEVAVGVGCIEGGAEVFFLD